MLKNGAKGEWQDEQEVPYAIKDNTWVGYDNPKSLRIKVGNCMLFRGIANSRYNRTSTIWRTRGWVSNIPYCRKNPHPTVVSV